MFFVDETGAEAQVETADIKAGKSVIHVIDAVLLPGPVEAAVAAPSTAPPPKEGTATSSARGLFTSAAALATTLLAAALLA